MKAIVIMLLLATLFGCSTSDSVKTDKTSDATFSANTASAVFNGMNRFPPQYPMQYAFSGTEGCATVAYTVTPDLTLKNIEVIAFTDKSFADEARKVVNRWDWAELSRDKLTDPLRLKTRFEYCLEDGSGKCTLTTLSAKTQCPGEDVVASVGAKIN